MAQLAEQAKAAAAPKPAETAYGKELRTVKDRLACPEHRGPNRWCYVSPAHGKEHIALGVEEIGLWAKKIVSES